MKVSAVMYPVDTLYKISTTHLNKKQKRYPKLLKFFDAPKKQERITPSEFKERIEIENDPTIKIMEGDHHYFPPDFQHIPAEKCKPTAMVHDSPWNENFGNARNKAAKKQTKRGKGERRRTKKAPKTKREIFMDVQMGILKCMVPQIGFLYDLEKAKQSRKKNMK